MSCGLYSGTTVGAVYPIGGLYVKGGGGDSSSGVCGGCNINSSGPASGTKNAGYTIEGFSGQGNGGSGEGDQNGKAPWKPMVVINKIPVCKGR